MTRPRRHGDREAQDGLDQSRDPLDGLDDLDVLDGLDGDLDDEGDGGYPGRARHRALLGPTEQIVPVDVALDPYILQEQMRAAGCTHLERQAVILWLRHRRAGRVARVLGLSRAKVIGMIASAHRRLRVWRARHNQGAAENQILAIYVEDVNRFGYDEEHHCAPGEEECLEDGVCKRRWYLFGKDTDSL